MEITSKLYKLSPLIIVLLFPSIVSSAPNAEGPDYENTEIIQKMTRTKYFELSDKHTIKMKIDATYDLVKLYEGHGDYISVMPCIDATIFTNIYDKNSNEIEIFIEKIRNKILNETYLCMKNEIKAEIENLKINYYDITDLGAEYKLPELQPPPEPITFEEWKKRKYSE